MERVSNDQQARTLVDLLPNEAIQFEVSVESWQEALQVAGGLLVSSGSTVDDYTHQMIAAVERYGPYIVIAPGFALAHAQASDSVLHTGMSWVRLTNPIEFGNARNDPVELVVGLASKNHDDHAGALQQLGMLLADPKMHELALAASTPEELHQLLTPSN